MKPARRPSVALAAMLLLVIVQAAIDPSGLLALVGWPGGTLRTDVGIWPFAPYVVFLPVLLAMTWWAARRAGERYWTLVAGLVLAVLLAQAAACLVMTWDPVLSAWGAGYVLGKAVPAALIVAALARWFGGPTERMVAPVAGLARTWPVAVVFAAIAPLVSGYWWTGAVYADGVPVARMDRGPVSLLVAVVVLAAATALCLRWMRARVPGLLGGWLAALVAGGMLGVVQALVAFVVDGGLDGGLWPLMAAYVAIADGLSFGACLGWIVWVGALVVDRVLERSERGAERSARSLRAVQLAAAIVAVVALGAALVLPSALAQTASAQPQASAALPEDMLRADGDRIVDGAGDQVLLRGVNVNQLVDFYQPQPDVPATRPLTEADFAGMEANGFDVVRLGFSWSALEPERGELDQDYLDRIVEAVGWAKQYGMYTVLDMHQDGWWAGATPEGETCRPGTDPMWGYDGAPEWATLTDGAPRCSFTGRDISPAGDRAFQHFYFDTDDVQTALVDTWGELAKVFRDEPAVAGYDLLNEPGFGETAPVTTALQLGRFTDRAIDEIRANGGQQIVFVEPSIFWSGLGFDSGPILRDEPDRNIVFSPHLYAESITMDRSLGLPPIVSIERQFKLAERVAANYDAPLWSGEYGYWGEPDDVVARLERYADAEDEYLLGSAYWVWKQACGDPQNGIGPTGNGLMVQDCETGDDAPPRTDLLDILKRAYPRTAPGELTSLEADGAAFELTGTVDGDSCGLDVWVPGADEPDVVSVGITDLHVAQAPRSPAAWRITGCASGDYSLATRR
ncbi:glycoside hydrolase family 5 protein [Agromyces terreus]|uniref:glycoside hydrolase family 5 protein n=1 Tax=Agromyces terreus TaxID=424795 RepID=UPI0031DFD769